MRRKLYFFLRCHYFLQCFPVQRILCVLAIFFLNIDLGICTCAQDEFEINGECCPMCSPGQHVKIHCSKLTKTTCLPCPDSTYSAKPNDRSVCSKCTVCNTVNGLRVKANCTQTSDTVCEPLEGFYCTDGYSGSCRYAVEHTKCSPGQYTKQKGTKASDTVCEPCSPGFYSPEGVNCFKWTDCLVRNEIEDEEGTSIRDVQCKPRRSRYVLIAAFLTAAAVVLLSLAVLCLCQRKAVRSFFILKIPVEETDPQSSQCAPSTSPLKDNEETESPAVQADCNKEHTVQVKT